MIYGPGVQYMEGSGTPGLLPLIDAIRGVNAPDGATRSSRRKKAGALPRLYESRNEYFVGGHLLSNEIPVAGFIVDSLPPLAPGLHVMVGKPRRHVSLQRRVGRRGGARVPDLILGGAGRQVDPRVL